MTKSSSSSRKPGAQPGNSNALKHGFYANRFTADESSRLNDSDRFDVQGEIDLLRVCIDRLVEELAGGDFDNNLKALNTLSVMTQSIGTLIRTHHLTKGKGGSVEQTIMEALDEIRMELRL